MAVGSGTRQKSPEILSPVRSHPSPCCGCPPKPLTGGGGHGRRPGFVMGRVPALSPCPRGGGGELPQPRVRAGRGSSGRVGAGRRRAWGAGDGTGVGCGGVAAGDRRDAGGGGRHRVGLSL